MNGERSELMLNIMITVGIIVGVIGLTIIVPIISSQITGGVNISSNANNHGEGSLFDFETARTVLGFVPTFVGLGLMLGAVAPLYKKGVQVKAAFGRGGSATSLNVQEIIMSVVSIVVGVIGISIFAPMVETLTSGALTPTAAQCVTENVTAVGGLTNLCTYTTAKSVVGFIPTFYAISLLVGAIGTIAVQGKGFYDRNRG